MTEPKTPYLTGDSPTILVIDDDANFLFGVSRLLTKADFRVIAATDGITGIAKAQAEHPDLILMDINMPKMTGFQAKKALEADPITQFIPVVFLTALNDDQNMVAGLNMAEDYITKPVDSTVLAARIRAILRRIQLGFQQAIVEADNSFHFNRYKEWAYSVEMLDNRFVGHTERVANMAVALATSYGISDPADLENIYKGAFLHDIGKLSISDKIMNKPGPLTDEEWELMRKHPAEGFRMLQPIGILKGTLDIPHYHHERWDGMGYPEKLSGDQIPIHARIFSLVDVFDALISKRPYKEAIPEEAALEIIRSQAGKHFDPKLTEHFLDNFEQIKSLATQDLRDQ